MMNTFTTFFFTLLALVSIAASAPLAARDVYVPPVLYPNVITIWKAGSRHNVTWDISNPPAQITNKVGMIVLAKGDYLVGLDEPLAKGFDILDGRHEVTIPADTTPGDDYSVVLFGDSGNNSGRFKITN